MSRDSFPTTETIVIIVIYIRMKYTPYIRKTENTVPKVSTMYIIKIHKYILQLEYLRLNYNLNKFKQI